MKVLLGGVPLGADNIGDEAIVACVVQMLKASVPGISLVVATADPGSAAMLGVEVVPSFGFGVPLDGFADAVRKCDAYVWCGATGLSDYPNIALDLLEIAQDAGVPTFVWGVGMDDELNPAFFSVRGKRRALLRCFGLVEHYQKSLRQKLARRISRIMPLCRGVWLRDPQSAAALAKFGYVDAHIAADTAILLAPASHRPPFPAPRSSSPVLGLCISTQRRVADMDGVIRLVERVRDSGASVVGIPMNSKTDRELLEKLGVDCISGTTPEAVVEAAGQCSLVLTSRLHLLILAANAGTPGIGIARGSKLANWLSNFGRTVDGSVDDCNWNRVADHVLAALENRGDWDAVRERAYSALMARLKKARGEFAAELAKLGSRGAAR